MKLDEIARLAGVSRTTASYVINGKAKQYRVSDKTVEKVMAVVREHNYHPNAVASWASCWTHTFYWSCDPRSGEHQLYPHR
ncbi:transcriptional regulator of the control of carbon and energy metabolism GalR/LacI family [Escherichia coli]|uniref:Transcriptional regulator of the control of carbon and energy metabolism GalR/LacI family n=1 Tax=Escherichia coli TaxID=562 RepID=A0A376LI45_ECOLX|nr:transcriptional regulator of the control of carbon and energy metabolism GalR/LacI family [Escherichia coli]